MNTKLALVVLMLLPLPGAGVVSAQHDDRSVAELIAVVESDQPDFDRAMACRQLAVRGDASAVDALAVAARDPHLSSYARQALEQIPDASATDALLGLAEDAQGPLLVGVIDSLGLRRDKRSIPTLVKQLDSDEPTVVNAAARALARQSRVEVVFPLMEALEDANQETVNTIALAALAALDPNADDFDGDPSDMFDKIAAADVDPSVKLAAIRGKILMSLTGRDDALVQLLKSEDEEEFELAVQLAYRLGDEVVAPVAFSFADIDPARQVVLLAYLGQQEDDVARTVVFNSLETGDPLVRAAALNALPDDVPNNRLVSVISGLRSESQQVRDATLAALRRLTGDHVDARIVELLDLPVPGTAVAALELVAARRMENALPKVKRMIDADSPEVRERALQTWATIMPAFEFPELVARFAAGAEEERPEIEKALAIACSRLPRNQSARVLVDAMEGRSIAIRVAILEQLKELGGELAVMSMFDAAQSDEDPIQDAATRLLGEWPSSDAAPVLLELARTLENNKYRIRVLRGLVRAARELDMPTDQSLEFFRSALMLSDRDDERNLTIVALKRKRSIGGLQIAAEQLSRESTRAAARDAVLTIASDTATSQGALTAELLKLAVRNDPSLQQSQAWQDVMTLAVRAAQAEEAEAGFVSLFDGSTLAGWHGNEDFFRIENKAVVAGMLDQKIPRNEFLRSNEEYGDFELRLQFKLLGEKPNAGVQIRTQEIPDDHEVSGYQADLGPGWYGCLYDESRRRRVLAGPPADQRGLSVLEGDWNDYRILCEGKRIRLFINGVNTVDYTESDADIPLSGIIALQVHSGEPMEAWYRNIRLRPIDSE